MKKTLENSYILEVLSLLGAKLFASSYFIYLNFCLFGRVSEWVNYLYIYIYIPRAVLMVCTNTLERLDKFNTEPACKALDGLSIHVG